MVSHEERNSRKWSFDKSLITSEQQTTKRQKTDYSPEFWILLSTVRLTQKALKGFDRRTTLVRYSLLVAEDLTAARYGSRKSSSRSDSARSSDTGKTKSTTPYSGEFQQKLIDQGIYPTRYRTAQGARPPSPSNVADIRDMLARPRPSLLPSTFSESTFQKFQDSNEQAAWESRVMTSVLPMFAGLKDSQYYAAGDKEFRNLQNFDPGVSVAKPDTYYGARPEQIDRRVRRDLDQHVTPSKTTNLPAAPSYFLEGKSASGRSDVAQRKAMYARAVSARTMLQLHNYGSPALVYDGNAYTMSATYIDGLLKMYTTYPSQPAVSNDRPKYLMHQVSAFAMTHSTDSFRSGATAYRNARDWNQQQRDRVIANANQVATNMSAGSRTTRANIPGVIAEESIECDISENDSTAGDNNNTKRQRRLATKSRLVL
ncbi:Hypothetical protein R9X50_00046500 [Acrodontium crateriforme]|uniref:DUF7924 domain-containing protein n=1 Tax=Acrodontium crateriforme TaxID=150365 RepID=A0AAQ3M0P9_9PEZI|nr:Hypothetical protein R9X50_00046500 [Acrodontium crateriforme]